MNQSDHPDWSFPVDIRKQVMRRWERGELLVSEAGETSIFPLRLGIKGPPSGQLAIHFDAVRDWIAEWRRETRVRVEWRSVSPRLLGDNSIPAVAWLDNAEDATAFIDKNGELERFRVILKATNDRFPQLKPWIARRPLQAIDLANNWNRLLDVVLWLSTNQRPNIYMRQIGIAGVHTKFIESNRRVLSEILDLVLPSDAIDRSAVGVTGFNRRYGFRDKSERTRFRFLDRTKAIEVGRWGLDVTIDSDHFARLAPSGISRVFITENEINFLTFPNVPNGLVVFGAGYGFGLLSNTKWLCECRIQYWGDIDTHGFAILDQLRAHLPNAESLLMDRETLIAFREFWGEEETPIQRNLPHLTISEAELYDDLRHHRLAPKLRLEQELVPLTWLEGRLNNSQ